MGPISSSVALKEAILILQVAQAEKGQSLKQQFRITYESLKPANLFLSALNDIAASPDVKDNLLGTVAGLASGFVSKKVFVGTSGNLFRNLLGSFLQLGISNLVANHPDAVRKFGQFIIHQFFQKKSPGTREES